MRNHHPQLSRKWRLGLVFIIGFLLILACSLFKEVKRWYPADEVKGTWQTKVAVLEAVVDNRTTAYKSDCDSQDDCFVQEDTCVPVIVDDLAPVDSSSRQIGRDLVDSRSDISLEFYSYEYNENGYHYVVIEYFDSDGCWETDQEIDFGYNYLDCPKWERVDVSKIEQRQDLSCTVELVTYRYLQTYPLSGEGVQIEWADPPVPPRGKIESSFKGQVTVISHKDKLQFEPDEYSDSDLYLKHFNEKQYIGVGPDGVPVIAGSEEQWGMIYDNMGE